jgi:hypothetical protein
VLTWAVRKTQGRVQPGEIVSIKYVRDREGAKYDYPDFRVSRKPPNVVAVSSQGELPDTF